MKSIKKFFNSFVFSILIVGCFGFGLAAFLQPQQKPTNILVGATYPGEQNVLPEYFLITDPNSQQNQSDLFLLTTNQKFSISFTNGIVENTTSSEHSYAAAYFPDKADTTSYYFFDSSNEDIALYYNLTNQDFENGGFEQENILKHLKKSDGETTQDYTALITDFVHADNFKVDTYQMVPSEFAMSFSLNTASSDDTLSANAETEKWEGTDYNKFAGSNIELHREGCYTLVIPYTYLQYQDGRAFAYATTKIVYTFMIFNSTTYLRGGQPNLEVSSFVHTASVSRDSDYSKFYFFNFDDQPASSTSASEKTFGQLPAFTYNPERYEITIEHIDADEKVSTFTLVYDSASKTLSAQNAQGQVVDSEDCPVVFQSSVTDNAQLYFNELGTYNFSFEFIYKTGNNTYTLPMSTQKQRLYVFGYQASYTTQERDENHVTKSKELKKFGQDAGVAFGQYAKSADITSMVNSDSAQHQTGKSAALTADKIKENITANLAKITPISTNQTPVKFKSAANVGLQTESGSTVFSKIYKASAVDKDGKATKWDNGTKFVGDNITTPGTYLVIAVYNFQNFLTVDGTPASTLQHYQIFYFTITNITPTVTVLTADGTTLPTNAFTNQDVYIVDNSAGADYDAEVSITLSALNYAGGNYFFGSEDDGIEIKTFASGSTYQGITYTQNIGDLFDETTQSANHEKYQNKPGVVISKTSPYHNAKFTIRIKASWINKPSEQHFTIDTNEIGDITAKNVSALSSTSYSIDSTLPSGVNITNQPLIFMWQDKASGVQTHAYYKYFPISDAQFYSNDDNKNANLLSNLLSRQDRSGVLPVNSMLDMESGSNWTDYANAKGYSSGSVPASYVRSRAGLYLFEIFDDAGNFTFQIFLIDNTSPIFVKNTKSNADGSSILSLLSSSDTITISSDNQTSYQILWGSKKGLYIKGQKQNIINNSEKEFLDTSATEKLTHYAYDGLGQSLNDNLLKALYDFFANCTQVINNVQIQPDEGSEIKYVGKFLAVDILPDAFIKSPKGQKEGEENESEEYFSYHTEQLEDANAPINIFDIELTYKDANGQDRANEGDYKFLIRDKANTKIVLPTDRANVEAFKRAPSAFLTITLTSDASRMTFFLNNDISNALSLANYSIPNRFYQDGDGNLHKNNAEGTFTPSNFTYNYQYFKPISSTLPLSISYIPYAKNGSQIESLTMEFYPFEIGQEDVTETKGGFTARAYYYTFSKTAARSLPIFQLTDENRGEIVQDDGNGTTAKTYSIAFSGNAPEAGRYVFKRTYVRNEGAIDEFDYYERTIELIIDRFDIISDLEPVQYKDETGNVSKSSESIVGGDIFISMYSDPDFKNFADITISFPDYDSSTHLNDGSFYSGSGSTMTEDKNPLTISLSTNKLPAALNIPKFKYTRFNKFDSKTNSYSVEINDALSYYGNIAYQQRPNENWWDVFTNIVYKTENGKQVIDTENSLLLQSFITKELAIEYIKSIKQQSAILEYQLSAKIDFTPARGTQGTAKCFRTNGTTNDGNYLRFFLTEQGNSNILASTEPIKTFTEPGNYIVTLYQAGNQSADLEGDKSFAKLYKFEFVIEATAPEFELLSQDEEIEFDHQDNTQDYYTNKKDFQIRWTDSSSKYMAKIDQNKINIAFYFANGTNASSPNSDELKSLIITSENDKNTHWINYSFPIWENGAYAKITLQFEGPTGYTKSLTKTLIVDYTAPYTRLATLMDKTAAATTNAATGVSYFSRLFQEQNMRLLQSADGVTAQTASWTEGNLEANMQNVSYSYSVGTGNYRYYSYMVAKDFFSTIISQLTSPQEQEHVDVYVRQIDISDPTENGKLSTYEQTTKDSFSKYDDNNFTNLRFHTDFDPQAGYYEIIERDYAGNMVVYLVYCNPAEQSASNVALAYTNDRMTNNKEADQTISDEQIVDGFNIYSNSGFKLTQLSYNRDDWGFYRVVINGIPTYYMSSPWLTQKNYVYKLGTGEPTPVAIEDIFEAISTSRSKQSIYLANRTTGQNNRVYVSVLDETLQTRFSSNNQSATLQILDIPSSAQIASQTAYVFPAKLRIAYWDTQPLEGHPNDFWNYSLLTHNENVETVDFLANPTGEPENWANIYRDKISSNIVSFAYVAGNLNITILVQNMTRFKFEITDNFGYTTTQLQLVNEQQFNEIESATQIYRSIESVDGTLANVFMSRSALTFNFNSILYNVEVKEAYSQHNGVKENLTAPLPTPLNTNNISSITLLTTGNNYDTIYVLNIFENDTESQDTLLRKVILRVYYSLPVISSTIPSGKNNDNSIWFVDKNGQAIAPERNNINSLTFTFQGQTLTGPATPISTFSNNVTIHVDDGRVSSIAEYDYQQNYSYSTYLSTDLQGWTNINDQVYGTGALGCIVSGVGTYYVLVKYDDENVFEDVYSLYVVSILNTDSISYYFHVDGLPVEPTRGFKYSSSDGTVYDTVYVLSVPYAERNRKVIEPNNEKHTVFSTDLNNPTTDNNPSLVGSNVRVEIYEYKSDINPDGNFVVIYIGQNSHFLRELKYQKADGTEQYLLQSSQAQYSDIANPPAIIANIGDNFNTLRLSFTKYYGIRENTINVDVEKQLYSGEYVKISPTVMDDPDDNDLRYLLLTRAGIYRLKFYDNCGDIKNVEMFGTSEYIYLHFISSVPFTVTYTDPLSQEEVVSEPINRAIYNGQVVLTLQNPNNYFATRYPIIHVKKDGKDYSVTPYRNAYTFTETGYYTVYFEAMSKDAEPIEVRQESYSFSIINENEARYAFEYATYSGYYVQRIVRDGIDVTEKFAKMIDDDKIWLDKIVGNGKTEKTPYLTALKISYYDEKTVGARDRKFVVTIATGEKAYAQTTATTFTFAFRINIATPPITVSIEEGQSTTKAIQVSFNVQEIYDVVGDCRISLPGYSDDVLINSDTLAGEANRTLSITAYGTGYIQVYSMSGNLLFSYKVTRSEPLAVWTIIVIIISVLAVGVIIFIAVKLRKRLKVK